MTIGKWLAILIRLAVAEHEMHDFIRSEKKQEWDFLCEKDCKFSFTADAWTNFFPRTYSAKHK